eukprot:GHVS01097145.1.p1 GENE.GHVS01097145.1~~GHVS01097145.1.p1  ORF type:complete len:477 (+),score=23.56 GHVS01097145.1:287-1717(+)
MSVSLGEVESPWTPETWKQKPILQNPFDISPPLTPDDTNTKSSSVIEHSVPSYMSIVKVEESLRCLPGLVQPCEIRKLRQLMTEVAQRKRFILQAGDCAERFLDCNEATINVKLKIILQMSLIISWLAKTPTVRIGRIAGQYAKPRSSAYETVNGQTLLTFRGDCVNGINANERTPDPNRLITAYFRSSATLNCVRSLLSGGFADLHKSKHWELDYVMCGQRRAEYGKLVSELLNTLDFMECCQCSTSEATRTVDFFTSHESLILPYESGLTRRGDDNKWYCTSAHMLWIGDRTRQHDHAHVEFCRGIENPIGVKVGPSALPADVLRLCNILNPDNVLGKVVLITRYGASKVETKLPELISVVTAANAQVVWQCDPMHGNTQTTSTNVKTRLFNDILQEFMETAAVHQRLGSYLGGVHFELTGEDVTECLGGPQELKEHHLSVRYATYCDPRLNYAQSMEMAFKIAKILRDTTNCP